MDGEALVTVVPGPDCLKELVKKVGLWLKLYKEIKFLYEHVSNYIKMITSYVYTNKQVQAHVQVLLRTNKES